MEVFRTDLEFGENVDLVESTDRATVIHELERLYQYSESFNSSNGGSEAVAKNSQLCISIAWIGLYISSKAAF